MKLLASVVATTFAVQSDNLCPSYTVSNGCYEQVGEWEQDGSPNAIRCKMTNPACLEVTCDYDGIKAEFRGDLFDNNPEQTTFLDQIENGDRVVLDKNDAPLVAGSNCYFTVGDGSFGGKSLNIDWSYADCSHLIDVTSDGDNIVYSAKLSVRGDDNDGSNVIEFYVDHKFGADCKYPAKITLNENFWVNQEDVEAHENETGNLATEFTCDFYSDPDRTEPINSNNIVNMGDTIYGQVTSKPLFGLSYELTEVSVTDAKDDTLTFNVIENGSEVQAVSSNVEDQQVTGGPLNFDWMSFGFQGLSNQNKLEIQCNVNLKLNIEDRCPTGYEIQQLSNGDQCVQVNKGRFKYSTVVDTCADANAVVALPTNEQDNRIFSDLVGYGKYDLWIGGMYDKASGKWINVNDRTEIGWLNWNKGEPNNYLGDEYYIHIILTDGNSYSKKNGLWNDHRSHDHDDWQDDRVAYSQNNAFICVKAPAY